MGERHFQNVGTELAKPNLIRNLRNLVRNLYNKGLAKKVILNKLGNPFANLST
jgi:hypothetical protein